MDGWKMSFLLGFPIFRGYVKLRGGISCFIVFSKITGGFIDFFHPLFVSVRTYGPVKSSWDFFCLNKSTLFFRWAMKKGPLVVDWVHRGWDTTQLYTDYFIIRIPSLNNQDSMDSKAVWAELFLFFQFGAKVVVRRHSLAIVLQDLRSRWSSEMVGK